MLHEINGRKFRALAVSTIEHEIWTMAHVREGGFDKFRPNPGENEEEFAARLLFAVMESGKMFLLLGAVLIPAEVADTDWRPVVGNDTADFLRKVTAASDKKQLRDLLIVLLKLFFPNGLSLESYSPTALKAAETPAQPAQS